LPLRWLKLASKTVTKLRLPILSGMDPSRIFPENPLFANTTTDTGDSPKLVGISLLKKLLFTNTASSLFEKSDGGRKPLNSLNLMSRNMSSGMSRTTSGNGPESLLLLTSSSANKFIYAKEASSARSPNSGTKVPPRSSWFKSIPDTTMMSEYSSFSGGEQNTPL
ncbi:hypothetical protein CY35_15G021700, partial [Sphagnum magellanicum]